MLFIPVSLVAGLLAGFLGKKLFDAVWGLVEDAEPPEPDHRDVSWGKLALALAVQGAIFRAVRGLADRATRISFYRATGTWPGEEEPDAA
jgi:hypothetical protein